MGTALACDEYELTMAQAFWRHRRNEEVAFEVAVPALPAHRGYLLAAGMETAISQLVNFSFEPRDIKYLAKGGTFDPAFLDYLSTLRFQGSVDALAEGTPVGAMIPLFRVVARRIEATLVESAVLAVIGHQTMIASKARRVVDAAQGKPVWDFSLRRLHGVADAAESARAAYIGGTAGTATVEAGAKYGIPTTGTMAHHYVLAYGPDGEQRAFEDFLTEFPSRAAVLVDTYDLDRGVSRAIAASKATGVPLRSIRIDSGDLYEGSLRSRRALDAQGCTGTAILVSNDLDEVSIDALLKRGAPLDAFGVGTMLGTSADAPYLGAVYKLVAQKVEGAWTPAMKYSAGKATNPGIHCVWRTAPAELTLGCEDEKGDNSLLCRMVERGERISDPESLDTIRERAESLITGLPSDIRAVTPSRTLGTSLSKKLRELTTRMIEEARERAVLAEAHE